MLTAPPAEDPPLSLEDEKTDTMSTTAPEKRDSVVEAKTVHPRRSFAKDVVLICTVTLAMILNVSSAASAECGLCTNAL